MNRACYQASLSGVSFASHLFQPGERRPSTSVPDDVRLLQVLNRPPTQVVSPGLGCTAALNSLHS